MTIRGEEAVVEPRKELDAQAFSELIEGLGFALLPPSHPGSPGCSGLLVSVRKHPTDEHFDPERVILPLRDDSGVHRWRTLSLLSPPLKSVHVCPGRMMLKDRFEKCLEFFTFGGTLDVIKKPGEMQCLISSPVPILELVAEEETVVEHLASEAESLWAEIRVRWGIDDDGFEHRLAQIAPLQLYTATLHSILSRWESAPVLEQIYHESWEALCHEKQWLVAQGLWPNTPLMLELLLAPDDAMVPNDRLRPYANRQAGSRRLSSLGRRLGS